MAEILKLLGLIFKFSMIFTTGNSENVVSRHSFDKVCVCMGGNVIRDFEGMRRGDPDRNFKMLFFSWGPGNETTKKKHKGVWETDRIKMKGYTHGLVSQQRNEAGSGGREKSLPFLSLDWTTI